MSIEDALAHPEVRIHEYGDGPNVHKAVALSFGDVEAAFAEADLVREDVFFFEGNTHLPMEQHAAVAQWGADGKLTLWSSTQTPHYVHRLLGKILDVPQAHIRVIAAPVGGGFGGKLDPVRPRDRGVQALPAHRAAGEVRAHARGGLLRPPRPAPGADVDQDRLPEGRRHHRHALPLLARRRRVRLLRRGVDVLYRRAPDCDVQDPRVQVRGRPRVHEQAAVRAQARPRHAAATLRHGVPDRQGRRAARPRSGGHAAAQPGRAVHEDCQSPDRDDDRARRVHRPRGRGLRLAGEARAAAEGQGHRHRVLVLPHRGGDGHLLERHAALGRGRAGGPQRARGGAVRRDRHRPGLGLDPRVSRGRGARHRAQGHPCAPGRHGSDPGRPRLVLLARHADGRQRGHPGSAAPARPHLRRGGEEARGRAGAAHRP